MPIKLKRLNLTFSRIFFISVLFLFLILNFYNSLAQTISGNIRIPVSDDERLLFDVILGGSIGGGSDGQGNQNNQGGPGGYNPGGGSGYSPASATGCNTVDENGVATFGGIGCLISNLTNNVVAMLAILFGACALATFLWGMVIFIKDADTPAEQIKGKDRMMWGLAALFVMVSVWGIVRMFQGFLGVDRRETQVVLPSVCTDPNGCNNRINNSDNDSNTNPLERVDRVPANRIPAVRVPNVNTTNNSQTTTPSDDQSCGPMFWQGECVKPLVCSSAISGICVGQDKVQ